LLLGYFRRLEKITGQARGFLVRPSEGTRQNTNVILWQGSVNWQLRAAKCRPYGKMAFVGAAFCRPKFANPST